MYRAVKSCFDSRSRFTLTRSTRSYFKTSFSFATTAGGVLNILSMAFSISSPEAGAISRFALPASFKKIRIFDRL